MREETGDRARRVLRASESGPAAVTQPADVFIRGNETDSVSDLFEQMAKEVQRRAEVSLKPLRDELVPSFEAAERRLLEFNVEAPALNRFISKIVQCNWTVFGGKIDHSVHTMLNEMRKILESIPRQFTTARELFNNFRAQDVSDDNGRRMTMGEILDNLRSSDGALSRLKFLRLQVEQRISILARVDSR